LIRPRLKTDLSKNATIILRFQPRLLLLLNFSGFYRPARFICANDILNKPVPDNIASCQFYDAYTLYAPQAVDCLNHTASLARGQVNLGNVAGYYHFRAVPQPRQYHKHLQRRRVLRLVADYKRLI
jgi:hypothetical protein